MVPKIYEYIILLAEDHGLSHKIDAFSSLNISGGKSLSLELDCMCDVIRAYHINDAYFRGLSNGTPLWYHGEVKLSDPTSLHTIESWFEALK